MTKADASFLEALESCTLDPSTFDHQAHLRMTWLYLRRDGLGQGGERLRTTIQRFATHAGAPGKYDEGVTAMWIARVAATLESSPGTFEEWLAANPQLFTRAA